MSETDKFRILYAEDEADLRAITCELLVSEGYECIAVEDGMQAMEKLRSEEFDLLLTDFRMPKMDGAVLLFWARENGYHLPVIFLSGNLERLPIELMALEDCCAAIVHKPASIEELVSAIREARERHHDFDCHGKAFRPEPHEEIRHFPGQHYH